jgi:3-oxoacyl-[acyl-carrier protein] reductase
MNKKRIAIVTGVSRLDGIGKAICMELAKQGIDIFFTYWTQYDKEMPWKTVENEPDLIQKGIENVGVNCAKIELDLMNETSISTLFEAVETQLGTPSILINNATYSTETNILNIDSQELDKHYCVNLKATALLISAFVKRFKSGENGRIVNLSSGQSLSAMSGEIAYAMTKAAIETLTRTIAHELAYKGITINAVNPGLTDSGWMNDDHKKLFSDRIPMGRFGLPEDAAKLIAFLVSEQAGWITGQIIHSEGGFIREKYG